MKKTNKTFKRFAAITSASLLAACAMAPVFTSMTSYAATGTGSIEITEDGTASNIKVYQIFKADVKDGTVSIIDWGNGIDVAKLGELAKADTTVIGTTTAEPPVNITFKSLFENVTFTTSPTAGANVESAQAVAKVLSDNTANTVFAETFAKLAARCIDGEGKAAAAETPNEITGLDFGYYVAVDPQAVANDDGYTSYSLGILRVLSDDTVEIQPKRQYPTFDKQILDKNDSTDTASTPEDWGEAADHDISDDVSFKLTATVPTNIDKYDTYKMVFHDDLQADVFTLVPESIKVYVGESTTPIATGFTIDSTTKATDAEFNDKTGKTKDFTVTFDNVKNIAQPGQKITIKYDAKLTDKANLGSTGNWNGAYLEYSNNPNVSGNGTQGNENSTAKSPVDYVVAFTYQTVIDKINGASQQPLAGAKFSLTKVKDGTTATDITNNVIDPEKVLKTFGVTTCNEGSTFEFKGLDDGLYVLMETETPNSSYTAIEPIIFTVSATETETDGSEALASLTVTEGKGLNVTNVYRVSEADGKFVANITENNTGAIYGKISNTQGSTLPGTGGIGTTIFYLGGGAMAAIGGIYLISKRRMRKSEE